MARTRKMTSSGAILVTVTSGGQPLQGALCKLSVCDTDKQYTDANGECELFTGECSTCTITVHAAGHQSSAVQYVCGVDPPPVIPLTPLRLFAQNMSYHRVPILVTKGKKAPVKDVLVLLRHVADGSIEDVDITTKAGKALVLVKKAGQHELTLSRDERVEFVLVDDTTTKVDVQF